MNLDNQVPKNDELRTLFTALYPYIMPDLSGCPKALIDQQIIVVARDFFHESQIFQWTGARVSVKEGKTRYEVNDYPVDYWCERIMQVVQYISPDDKNGNKLIPGYDFMANGNNGLILAATPPTNASKMLQITVVLLPNFDCKSMPTDLFNHYYYAIAAGVKAKCQAMPKTTWTDMQSAAINQELLNDGLLNARMHVDRGYLNTTLIAKPGFRFA